LLQNLVSFQKKIKHFKEIFCLKNFSPLYSSLSELSITEIQTEYYSHENRLCKRYNDGKERNSIIQDSLDFMECSRREMWKLMKPKINCSIVGLEQFFDRPNEMSQCQSKEDAWNTFGIYFALFYESIRMFWINSCTVPCIQVEQIMRPNFKIVLQK
jgi:hypothetical protein